MEPTKRNQVKRLLAVLVLTGAVAACHPPVQIDVPVVIERPEPPACQEDEPCWDCTTMGNLICGPES